jgi:ABC-2 type transport system permease protein
MKQALSITRKELGSYFGSPMALIFIGVFLATSLFVFFWVETFFSRGISDVRPLFQWMPVLLILLVSALTMRQWSEEQRSGTLEILLTLPVSHIHLVLGKFLAVITLVAIALGLTLFLPITVSILGNLDLGPVIGGYLAAILLASSYAAIGLFVSSRTDNQIVSLILTVLLGVVFYGIGSRGVTDFLPDGLAEIMRAFSTGSRFESIERGVIDLRDLIYYLSLTALFLALNVTSLDVKRWSHGTRTLAHRRTVTLTTVLVALNLVAFNVWLYPLRGLRLDLTARREYSLSNTTRDLLSNLQEPLLVRGYFSERTHPLLSPLIPQIRDMLSEYEIASRGKIELEIIDPTKDPEQEEEANQVYGISPTPFQVAGRYESSVINSYFDILIRYGDQSEVLSFSDLIEVEQRSDDSLEVRLRNLEYDLTRTMKKVIYGFQSVDAVLRAMNEAVQLVVFITSNTLPEWLMDAPNTIEKVAGEIQMESDGKFSYQIVDLDDPSSPFSRQDIYELYGLQPIAVSLFSDQSYYLYMILQVGDQTHVLYPSGELTEADIRTNIEATLKRASPGFLKVVGLWQPQAAVTQDIFGQIQQPLSSWDLVQEQLGLDYEVRDLDLTSGEIPTDVDILVLIAPQDMTEQERFAIDQYLMRGGAVVVAAGNYAITTDQYSGALSLRQLENGIQDLLKNYGIDVEMSLVMDPQNEPFPVQVARQVGGVYVQEIQLIDYPLFVDVRPDGMDGENPIVANLSAVTLNWASPLTMDEAKNEGREVSILLQSSADAWLKSDVNIQPDFDLYPDLGFARGEGGGPYPLAVAVRGAFESYFKDKPSPFDEAIEGEEGAEGQESVGEGATGPLAGTIEVSPETARLVVIGSAEFIDDVILELSANIMGERYLNSLQLMQNAIDWSVEDLDLLSIRSRGTQAKVLKPMDEGEQSMWEGLNYAVALIALLATGVVWNMRRKNEQPMELIPKGSAQISDAGPTHEDRG